MCNIRSIRRKTALLRSGLPVLLLLLLSPRPAQAIQIHGPPEGLYAHLIGHFIFFCALVFLLYVLEKRPLDSSRGWLPLKLSLIFFLLWNADTFAIHLLSLHMPDSALFTDSSDFWEHRLAPPIDGERLLYYIGRFDHLLCVPAMWLFLRSLTIFAREAEQRRAKGETS